MFNLFKRSESAEQLIAKNEAILDEMQEAEDAGDGHKINQLSKQHLKVCYKMAASGCAAIYDDKGEIIWVKKS